MDTNKKKIAVLGSEGYVGTAMIKMLNDKFDIVRFDPALKKESASRLEVNKCDLAVICVPTPMDSTEPFPHPCDISIVEDLIVWLETPVILIKSTIAIGTCEYLKKKYKKRICMSPEYVGESKYYIPAHLDFSNDMKKTPFWVIGGEDEDVKYIYNLFVPILGPLKKYMTVTCTEAEIVKYFENYYLAQRVILANEMKSCCDKLGVNYYRVREAWLCDPRINDFHSIAFHGKEGFSGKCLPKDMNALLHSMEKLGVNCDMLRGMLKGNYKMRKENKQALDYEYKNNNR
jgi:UDPglucose 6-dehydrogenase